MSHDMQQTEILQHLTISYNIADPLPGMYGLSIAPMIESVASTAFNGSDSNHLSRMCEHERQRG